MKISLATQPIFTQNGVLVIIFLKKIIKPFKTLFNAIRSLRGKFLITYCIVGFIPLLVFASSITFTMKNHLINQKEIRLKRQANRLSTTIVKSGYLDDRLKYKFLEEEIDFNSQSNSNRVLVLDENAKVIGDSSRAELDKTMVTPEVLAALNKKDTSAILEDSQTIQVAVSIISGTDEIMGTILLVDTISEIYESVEEIQRNMLFTLVPMSVIILMVVILSSFLLIEPLDHLLEAVSKMSDGHLEQQVEIKGSDEFAELGKSFNEMSTKLAQVETARQEFVSNVSHELKTPLSSVKVLSEALLMQEDVPVALYKEFLEDINSEVDRMARIIDELLMLVRIDQIETQLVTRKIQVSDVTEDLVKRLEPMAGQKNITIIYEVIKDASFEVDEMKVSLAISNIVENAIKYTDDGGMVTITVDADHQNAFITVSDTGIGIEEEEIPHVFTRFYRVDKTRARETGGTGLGLAITHKTVLQHHGSIRLTSDTEKGSTFLVRLPLVQPD